MISSDSPGAGRYVNTGGTATRGGGGGGKSAGYADWGNLLAGLFGHPASSGRMAARGAAQYAAKIARLEAGAADLRYRTAQAQQVFHAVNPNVPSTVVTTPPPDPKLEKIQKAAVAVGQLIQQNTNVRKEKKLLKKQQELEQKMLRRSAKIAPQTEVRIATLAGANAGYWRERGAPPPAWLSEQR